MNRGVRLALGAVLLVSATLRFYGLTEQSLWNDELAAVNLAQGGPFSPPFWARLQRDVHPPGYQLWLWGVIEILGDSEFVLRASSALAGVGGVLVTYLLGVRLFGPAPGVFAAFFAGISPLLIRYSQEVRGYSLNYLLAALLGSQLLGLVHGSPRLLPQRVRILSCGFLAALAGYMHYMGLVVAVGLFALVGAVTVWTDRCQLKKLAAAFAVAALMYAPWAFGGLMADLSQGGLSWLETPTVEELLDFPGKAVPYLVMLGLMFTVSLPRPAEDDGPGSQRSLSPPLALVFCGLWCFGLVSAVYAKSLLGPSLFLPRNLLGALPPLFVVLGAACSGSMHRVRPARATWAFLLGVLAVWKLVASDEYYSRVTKEPFRDITADAVAALEQEPELLVFGLGWGEGFYFNYYFRQLGSDHRVAGSGTNVAQVRTWLDEELRSPGQSALLLSGHVLLSQRELASLHARYRVRLLKWRSPVTALYRVTMR